MTVEIQSFQSNSAYVIAATTTTSNTALTQPPGVTGILPGSNTNASAGNAGGYTQIKVYNAAAKVAYLQAGMAAQTATASSPMQVAPGATQLFELGIAATNLGVILESGASAANVYVMLGTGGV